MLAKEHRLTEGSAFRRCVRTGRRAGSRTVVAHLAIPTDPGPTPAPPRVGLVVSKAVGTAVVRNRVKRRLRHLMRPHLLEQPPGTVIVIRALPAAAEATSEELRTDLTRCLHRATEEAR